MKDIIVYDIECTCWDDKEGRSREDRELIEIGAVRLDEQTFDIVDTFDIFAKPVRFPILSEYCTNLTTIVQTDVQDAYEFAKVLAEFTKWYKKGDSTIFISWGWFDKNHIIAEASRKKYWGDVIQDLQRDSVYINLKEQFSSHFQCKGMGMEKALRKVNLPLDGTHHRGVDDAKNIAKIAKILKPSLKI